MKTRQNLLLAITQWLEKMDFSNTFVLGSVSVIVGLISGIGIWLFRELITLFEHIFFDVLFNEFTAISRYGIILIPALGGLIVGLLVHFFVREERHHGVAGIMESVALAGGRLRYQRVPVKAVSAAISIGSGASVGPEDPSVQIGANVGSMFGQWLGFSEERVRALVAGGAAGGIAAAFNAPIAGVFFAMEIIVGEISAQPLGIILVASVVSSIFSQAVSGSQPAFSVPAYSLKSVWEMPLYLGLGLLSGVVSALYIHLLYLSRDIFQQWQVAKWLKPAFAGLIIGLVGLFLPQVFGVGYETIGNILNGESYSAILLVSLLLAKLFLTPVSIGGGFQGGVFAPALFLGAALGAAWGLISDLVFPAIGILPPAFAMVGMAAVLAGTVHAPMTAILLLFEMTHDYRIILPLMFAVAASMLISTALQKESVYTLSLHRKGIQIKRGRDLEVLEGIQIGEVMQKDITPLQSTDTLEQAAQIFASIHTHGLPVLDQDGKLHGLLSISDLEKGLSKGTGKALVGAYATRNPLVGFPDETMGTAIRRMGTRDVGRLPIVSRDDPTHLLGVLSRTNIVRAYDIALSRRAALRHRVHQVRLGALRGDETGIHELTVLSESAVVNKPINATRWPRDCIIASLRRGGRLIIPRGDTVIYPGDHLIVVSEQGARAEIEQLCQQAAQTNPE